MYMRLDDMELYPREYPKEENTAIDNWKVKQKEI